jgi:hypothetical protein
MKTTSPLSNLRPPGYRSGRWTRRRRRRVRAAIVTVLVAGLLASVAGVRAAFVAARDRSSSGSTVAPPSPVIEDRLAVIAVRGTPSLAAVIGSRGGAAPAVVALPSEMTFTVPGQGEGTIADAADLPAGSFRTAVSNLLGTWIQHYAAMNRPALGAIVDRVAGIQVDLQDTFDEGDERLGPGPARLTGDEVLRYLDIRGPHLELRWELVLEGLLRSRPALLPSDFVEVDDAATVIEIVDGVRGAPVQQLPVKDVGGDPHNPLIEPNRDALSAFVAAAFGGSPPEPVPVVVVNGSGAPGVGALVANRIVPAGFRVVLSQNAQRFDHETTAVIASGDEHVDEAALARNALGVGEVQVTKVPSGLADVTIVIGKDFGRG